MEHIQKKEKVSVIGIGRLGLSFALLLDSKGYGVCGCDVNEKYIESLKEKTFKSDEPQINDMLNVSKIKFTSSSDDALNYSSVIFIFVSTPSKENGEYDTQFIEQVIGNIEKANAIFKTVIICCTVNPGYCELLQERLLPLRNSVVYNPEFIVQGDIINGLKNSDIVLIGGKIPSIVRNIYVDIMDKSPVFKSLSLIGAEIAKIAINCFLTMKIVFANMIGEISLNSGEGLAAVNEILETVGSDSRIGNKFLGYGFPSGGVCLPRDQKALKAYADKAKVNTKFLLDIDEENKRHSEYLKDYWIKKNPNKNIPFLFSYLGYKQGVYILTESYQLKLCMELLRDGYKVIVLQDTTKMDMPKEFKDYCDAGMVITEENKDAIIIN